MRLLTLLSILAVPLTLGAQERASDALFTWSGRVASGGTLSIRHFNGPMEIREATGDRVEFRAERRTRRSEEVSFQVENVGDGVRICAVWRERNICDRGRGWSDWGGGNGPPSSRVTVLLPRGVRLDASTGNGAVTVDRASSDVQIRTGNGDVRISLTAGQVDVSTGNGDLDISGATGPVRASSGNGRVYVTTASGPVTARTGNGAIDVRMRSLANAGDMTFASGNGSITVALPSDFNGEIDASTGRGELRSDFEIRVMGRLNPRHIRGTIGSGGRTIKMSTGNGRLEIRKID